MPIANKRLGFCKVERENQRSRPPQSRYFISESLKLVFAAGDKRQIVSMPGENSSEVGAYSARRTRDQGDAALQMAVLLTFSIGFGAHA